MFFGFCFKHIIYKCLSSLVFTVGGTRPSKGNYSVLLWGGENEERCYSVIDCQTGFYQVPQTLCLGCRVACLVRVGDRYWLGTEVTEEWTGHEVTEERGGVRKKWIR